MDNPQPQPTQQTGQNLPSPISSDNYTVSLLDPAEQKFLEDLDSEKTDSKDLENKLIKEASERAPLNDILKDVPVQETEDDTKTEPQEEPDDEEDEVFFDATDLDLKTSTPQEERPLTQHDLDNLRSLDEQLLGEFDCLA